MKNRLFLGILLLILSAGPAQSGNIPLPDQHGKVRLNNFSIKNGMRPVIFDHWLHRALFTCRVCHVDIGFALKEEATQISAELNMQGEYCGACHNGKRVVKGTVVFDSCAKEQSEEETKRCSRCHSEGKENTRQYTFDEFTENLPRLSAARQIDWEKAEEEGIIKPVDFLEGVSFKRDHLKEQEDFSIEVTTWASDVIFSHKKHAVWNGCELCHPQVFPSSKKGTVNYTMFQIMRGEYCGVCHIQVAFSVWLCNKCHKKPVR